MVSWAGNVEVSMIRHRGKSASQKSVHLNRSTVDAHCWQTQNTSIHSHYLNFDVNLRFVCCTKAHTVACFLIPDCSDHSQDLTVFLYNMLNYHLT